MNTIIKKITEQCEIFSPFSESVIKLESPFFRIKTGKVSDYVAEITNTISMLKGQTDTEYTDVYAQRLLNQFETLHKATKTLQLKKIEHAVFHSTFQFPKNIHYLPSEKRLIEYRKALRALNEKISWLMEQAYTATPEVKEKLQQHVLETEYRKAKCVAAIEDLEEKLTYR